MKKRVLMYNEGVFPIYRFLVYKFKEISYGI